MRTREEDDDTMTVHGGGRPFFMGGLPTLNLVRVLPHLARSEDGRTSHRHRLHQPPHVRTRLPFPLLVAAASRGLWIVSRDMLNRRMQEGMVSSQRSSLLLPSPPQCCCLNR
ncbi:hypothetical protein DAI22_11g211150 [Oryza sativa Japonica Group]|nr:hypothetical protein DAI22_11g211150 [Oryza sativa Japonica Group]